MLRSGPTVKNTAGRIFLFHNSKIRDENVAKP
jgi:hypothetical protein